MAAYIQTPGFDIIGKAEAHSEQVYNVLWRLKTKSDGSKKARLNGRGDQDRSVNLDTTH
eukprot:Awhi_evm1s8175